MCNPLEQFEPHWYGSHLPLVLDSTGLTGWTTLTTGFLVQSALLTGLLWLGLTAPAVVQAAGLAGVIQGWWSLLAGVVRGQLDQVQKFTPLLVWTFGWIAVANLAGLTPAGFTTTAHLSVTLYLALGFNLGFLTWGVYHHGARFFGLFVPRGAPPVLLPLIVVIELVSYCIRPVSLALRLFANMMAGHTLVHILLGFAAGTGAAGGAAASAGVFAVTALEFGIALLQAYVFVVLCCIYARDGLDPGH